MRRKRCLDRRIAAALCKFLGEKPLGVSTPPRKTTIAFSNHEDSADEMEAVCELADWKPKTFKQMQARLSRMALRLTEQGVLDRRRQGNQLMYIGETAQWQYRYKMTDKWLMRLFPKRWKGLLHYKPEDWSTPKFEWKLLMQRMGLRGS